MCLVLHNKAKAQSGLKSFHFVSCGVLTWWPPTGQQNLREPLVQLFAPSVPIALSLRAQQLGAGGFFSWHFQNATTAACSKEVKEGRLNDDSE